MSNDSPLELLRRIRQWDMLDACGDGPYWKREIDSVLSAQSEIGAQPNAAAQADPDGKRGDTVSGEATPPPASAAPSDDKAETPRTDDAVLAIALRGFGPLRAFKELRKVCNELERELNAARSATGTTGHVVMLESQCPRCGKSESAMCVRADCFYFSVAATDSGRTDGRS